MRSAALGNSGRGVGVTVRVRLWRGRCRCAPWPTRSASLSIDRRSRQEPSLSGECSVSGSSGYAALRLRKFDSGVFAAWLAFKVYETSRAAAGEPVATDETLPVSREEGIREKCVF